METQNVGKKLYQLAHGNETADAVVHALASRERLRHFIDIRRLKYSLKKDGFKIIDNEYMNLWKEWEKMGLGSIVRGRIGNDDRFVMNYDMRKVAEASMNGTDLSPNDVKKGVVLKAAAKVIGKRGRKPKVNTEKPMPIQPVAQTNSMQLIISLKNDEIVKINLPAGLNKEDIKRITNTLSKVI
jgi:hypothetical protein